MFQWERIHIFEQLLGLNSLNFGEVDWFLILFVGVDVNYSLSFK